MELSTVIGIAGSAIILIFFLANQLNKIKNDHFYYDFFNFIGSSLLLVYAIMTNSIPFVVLNAVWAVFSLKDILVKLFKKRV